MYNYPVMRQVPPRIVKFDYMEPTSTSTMTLDVYEMCITTAGVIFVKSDYDVHDYIRCGFRQVPLRICQVRLHDASSTSTIDPWASSSSPKHEPLLSTRTSTNRVQLLSPCTTTSTTVARTSTSATAEYNYFRRRLVNDYFLYETRTAPKTHASKV